MEDVNSALPDIPVVGCTIKQEPYINESGSVEKQGMKNNSKKEPEDGLFRIDEGEPAVPVQTGDSPLKLADDSEFITNVINSDKHEENFTHKPHSSEERFNGHDKLKKYEEMPYVCDLCGIRFSQSASLKAHKMTHLEKLVCEVCSAGFTLAINLNAHKMIHTGEKPHVCDFCGLRFIVASNLKAHKAAHAGKTRVCGFCDAGFADPENLKNHINSHTERLYSCGICDSKFIYASYLSKQIKTHSSEKTRSCNDCRLSFASATKLNQHKKIAH